MKKTESATEYWLDDMLKSASRPTTAQRLNFQPRDFLKFGLMAAHGERFLCFHGP